MIVALPVRENAQIAASILRMLMEKAHIDERGIFSVELEDWEIDLLSCYDATDLDLEESDDDEDLSPCG